MTVLARAERKRTQPPSLTAWSHETGLTFWNARLGRGNALVANNSRKELSSSPDVNRAVQIRLSKASSDYVLGKISSADLAKAHQDAALAMYPTEKTMSAALAKFFDSELGKQALLVHTHWERDALQKAHRIGDGDIFVQKNMLKDGEDTAARFDGEHRYTSHGTNADNLNSKDKFAAYAKEYAEAHAKQMGVSVHHAIDELLANSQYYRLLLRGAGVGA